MGLRPRRRWPWRVGLAFVLCGIGVLVGVPARWVWAWAAHRLPGVALVGVGGTLWQGRAQALVLAGGPTFRDVHWRLSRWLLLGRPAFALTAGSPALELAARREPAQEGRTCWREVSLRLALDGIVPALPALGGTPTGRLSLDLDDLLLAGGWPLALDGHARWQAAGVRTADGPLALGELDARLEAQAGVVRIAFADTGDGPLAARGTAMLSPLGWLIGAKLAARRQDPALARWLAGLGPADAHGVVHLARAGGLAQLPSEP